MRRKYLEENVRLLEDRLRLLSEPLAAENRQIAFLESQLTAWDEQPAPFPAPALAHARQIPSGAPPYARALQATVERGIEAARFWFDEADRQEAARPKADTAGLLRIRLARAEAEQRSGNYREAGAWARKAAALNPRDPQTLWRIAWLLLGSGDYPAAEALLKAAGTHGESAPEHSDTAICLGILGLLRWYQQRWEEVESPLMRALNLWEKILGPEHPRTAACLDNLGALYGKQKRFAEAEPLLKRALNVWERILGPEHPHTAVTLYNLGRLYHAEHRFAEAEPLLKRVLNIQEKTLGPEHPDAATCLDNLGALYCTQNRFAEAEPLLKRAVNVREKTLGPEHPDTAVSLSNLGVVCCCQQRFAEAESLLKRAAAIEQRVFGTPHPTTRALQENLAALQNETPGRSAHAGEETGAASLPIFHAARQRRKRQGS